MCFKLPISICCHTHDSFHEQFHACSPQYEKDTRDMSQSFSYSYSFSFEYAPTTSPSLVPAIAPTMQPNLPGTIPVVNLFLVVAGTPEEQFALVSALVLYFIMALDVQESDISVDTPVLERLLHQSRRLADTDQGRLCSSGAPQNSTSISIRNYEDAAKVQDSLDGIMNGTISLTAVEGDSTTFPVKDGICHGETTLSFVPPPADTLNDKNKSSSEPEPLSATYISLIAVGGVAILCVIIFVARRRRPRSTVVAHN
ncbi:hypothetical protein Naga_100032g20 [Nannochloropsis gaditana]|uniref:Uncharacterized protein n=1 Tax=Nannochloropsis gaditana TaxID=72520 RepID=W7THF1_9STRA|nr:hypothetical protein Naga_100032g20 [Nannochloropsis gaditana]